MAAGAVLGGWGRSCFSHELLQGLLAVEHSVQSMKKSKISIVVLQAVEYAPTISWLKRLIKQ